MGEPALGGRPELLGGCAFFKREDRHSSVTELLKEQYCADGDPEYARYLIATKVGREHVPVDLFPNDTETAASIIAAQAQSFERALTPQSGDAQRGLVQL